ncbi:MAG: hypothetical protein WC370_09045 [Dehalococcoidales bacterium]
MVLVWKDMNSFRHHADNMKTFRQTHPDNPPAARLRLLQEIPFQMNDVPSCGTEVIESFTDARGKLILIPIWEINTARGSQN